jgi:hypothetical protein
MQNPPKFNLAINTCRIRISFLRFFGGLIFFLSLFLFPLKGMGEDTEAIVYKLLEAVQNLPADTEFIRNGSSHTKEEAVKHLMSKYNRVKKRLATPEDFIENIASKSSISGKEYVIKYSDNKTVFAGDFFKQELKRIRE